MRAVDGTRPGVPFAVPTVLVDRVAPPLPAVGALAALWMAERGSPRTFETEYTIGFDLGTYSEDARPNKRDASQAVRHRTYVWANDPEFPA